MSVVGQGRPQYYQDREVAASYHQRYQRGLLRWKHQRKCDLIGSWLQGAESVLEVACGPGRFHNVMCEHRHVGIDLSREMINEYRQRESYESVAVADASRLPFADNSFDFVMSTRFLAHLRDEYREQVLRELVRVCRRGVILDGRHRYNFRFASRWIRRRLGLAKSDKLRHTYQQFRDELASVGLEVEELRSIAWGLSARFVLRARKRQ